MDSIKEKWNEILEILEQDMLPHQYTTWIDPLRPISVDEKTGIMLIETYNDTSKSIINNRYINKIENAVEQIYGKNFHIKCMLSEDISKNSGNLDFDRQDPYITEVMKRPGNDELYLNPRYNFSTFVVGSNNELAYAAAQAVAKNPATEYNPLFLYGNSGLGKTHLMQAIGHYVLQNNPSKRVLYVSSEMFTNELVNAIQIKKMDEFRNKYRSIDVFMIDDIQFIEKKDRTQEELFHTFNTLYESSKQIVISSDRPPKEIETIDTRLQSRFEWGLPVDIQ